MSALRFNVGGVRFVDLGPAHCHRSKWGTAPGESVVSGRLVVSDECDGEARKAQQDREAMRRYRAKKRAQVAA